MHYPFWYVPGLTSPMWIAVVAVLHMYSAMYAVGGSILLVSQTRLAYRVNDRGYLDYLHSHAWFFAFFTLVYGALTGVGIWWTIGLASPLATEELIHIFVLVWAFEYVSFFVEIVSAFIFFYYWGRLDRKTHVQMGWIYAISALVSLVAITAITAFQLSIGGWSPKTNSLYQAFFNPQAFPQIAARIGGSLLLGSLYFFLHSSLKVRDDALKARIGKQSAKWAMAGAVLTILGGVAWYVKLPPSGNAALVGAAVLNVLMTIIFLVTAGVVVMMYFGPIKNPSWLTPGFAILFFGFGLVAIGAGEFIREGVRKPYIVYQRVLGNQIRPEEIPRLRRDGYLSGGVWTSAYMKDKYPDIFVGGKTDESKLLSLPLKDRQEVGKTIFMYHCNDCHAIEGYSAVAQLSRGWRPELIDYTVRHLDRVHYFMPPWSGTDAEARVLTEYIQSIQHPYPAGLARSLKESK